MRRANIADDPPGFRAGMLRFGPLVGAEQLGVRHPEGSDQLEPWDAVCFPSGPEGASATRPT
jgi:hypothetical protein